VAAFAGFVEVSVGAVTSMVAPVVKVQTYGLANELPEGSLAPAVIVAVKVVLAARLPVGANVAILQAALQVTTPFTPATIKVAVVMVAEFMGLLKTAMICSLMGTAVAPIAGLVELTVTASNVTVNGCVLLVIPELVTATFWAPTAALAAMVNVAVMDVPLDTTTLLTVMPVPLRLIVDAVPKFVPVSVTLTACPCVPELELTEVSVGT
jgi:hypothetical protein